MRGRKPTPTVLKLLSGNPGRRAINGAEPQPGALAEAVPEELTEPEGIAEWVRTIVPAIQRGQVTGADRAFAIAFCHLWAVWRSQVVEAATRGHVVAVGPNNHPMPNPYRSAANKTMTLLTKIGAELGLSPSSRSRVHVSGKATEGAIDNKWAGVL